MRKSRVDQVPVTYVWKKKYVPLKFRLRWRFDFLRNGLQHGFWDDPGAGRGGEAWKVNKDGICRACVEGIDLKTGEVKPIVECDGWDFVNFEWIAAAAMPVSPGPRGVKVTGSIQGMVLVTRDKKYKVFLDGRIKVENRSQWEKERNLVGFGR